MTTTERPAVLHTRTPCCGGTVHVHALGILRRICRTCKRVWLLSVERASVSERVGRETWTVRWSEGSAS